MPAGVYTAHVHYGCDVFNAATVKGHFYDPDLCKDPWLITEIVVPISPLNVTKDFEVWLFAT